MLEYYVTTEGMALKERIKHCSKTRQEGWKVNRYNDNTGNVGKIFSIRRLDTSKSRKLIIWENNIRDINKNNKRAVIKTLYVTEMTVEDHKSASDRKTHFRSQ